MHVLYITSAAILVRNIVRVAEFIEGFEGYIILHEAFLYAFDALPMLIVMIILGAGYLGDGAVVGARGEQVKSEQDPEKV